MHLTGFSFKGLGAAAATCLLLSGCACPKNILPTQRDTVYVHRTDSLLVRDSIYVDHQTVIKERGDTVYVRETVTEYRDRWRDRHVTDTLWREREVTVTEYVERQPTRWEVFWQQAGKVLSAVLVLGIAAFFLRRRLTGR